MLESRLADREKIAMAQFDYRDYIRNTLVDYQKRSGKAGPNYPKKSTRYDLTQESTDLRRLPKQLWNQLADHQFFKENIRKFHTLGYAGKLDVQKYFSSSASKNEISCFAVEKSDDPKNDLLLLPEASYAGRGKLFLELEGRTTWCGNFDAFTEQLKDATPGQIKKMSSSGLAKRPGRYRGEYLDLTNELILDADDLERNQGMIEELVLDNWKVKCFWFVIRNNKINKLLDEKALEKSQPIAYDMIGQNSIKQHAENWFFSEIGQSHEDLRKVAAICEKKGIPMKVLIKDTKQIGNFQTLIKVAQHIKDSVRKGYFEV